MARKKTMEPERWITVNGQHLPVYPGGVIGQPGQEPPKEKKSDENKLVEKAHKKLSGMSGIDQSKVAEMSQQAINGIKAGTFDRNAAKAYGLSDEDFDSLRKSANSGSSKKFSAGSSAERINAISRSHNNGGSEGEDWKKVRTELDSAPAGTVMIQTGNRGVKFQYEKQADGNWKNTDTGYVQDSKTVSMGWTGSGSRPQVEFTTSKNALTNEQVKASQDAAVSGRLNQALGLDRNGRKIGNRSTPKVDSSAPRTTSRNAKYDTSRATTKSSNLNSMSVSELRAMAKEYGVSQKTISAYDADELRMLLTGLFRKK